MATLVYIVVFLALTSYSSATYCLCRDGVGSDALQKAIDYACNNGADCSAIQSSGSCFQPNTVKDHCNYAVNSYYQRKVQSGATCDFSGTATQSVNPPSNQVSTCVYPSSASPTTSTGTTPTTPNTSTGTPPSSTSMTPPSTTFGTPLNPTFGGGSISPIGNSPYDAATTLTPAATLLVIISSALVMAFCA